MKLLQRWVAGMLATLAACGTARVIQKTPSSGVIELQGDHNKAMEQANEEMVSHCGAGNFTVLSEGYEVVPPDAGDSTGPVAGPASGPTAPSVPAPPRAPTAWRVRYQCEAAPLGTVAPPSPPITPAR